MDTKNSEDLLANDKLNEPLAKKAIRLHLPIKIRGKEITLNVGFKNAMARFGITLLLPMIMLLIDARLMIYTAPVMAYLFITGITHYCPVKYFWQRVIRHGAAAAPPPYGENMNYPDESV